MLILAALIWVMVGILLVPMAVFVVESLAALLPRRREATSQALPRPACAVLVPAHNEEVGIAKTIESLLPQLQSGDRILVVADNCTDQTSAIARSLGAVVVERNDPDRRGKSFALDFGVRFLESSPPGVVVIVDADCVASEGCIDRLVREVNKTGRPVQAAYILDAPPGAGSRGQLASFAFQYKNVIRPLGLDRLGLPCQMTGTGMGFPWEAIREADLAHGNIGEEWKLGVDLALAGRSPKLSSLALVRGELPSSPRVALTQRTRWEHGHLATSFILVPRLVWGALRQRRLDLLGLALEFSVPPLSMLLLLWIASMVGLFCWSTFAGRFLPAIIMGFSGLAILSSIFASWIKYGRDQLPLSSLLASPFYVLWKVPIYLSFVFRPQLQWIRTERDVSLSSKGSRRE